MDKYYKNLILCGLIDFYCLVCEETIQYGRDLEKHIRWEKHRNNMKNQAYLPKFKKDCIYKVGNHYYCVFCNFAIATIAQMTEHINSEFHKSSKARTEPISFFVNADIIKRDPSNIVICSNITTKAQWHGVFKKECLLCKTKVEDSDEHIATSAHMIKFIKQEISSKGPNQYYKKINNNIFQCFVCKKVFPIDIFEGHWEDTEHLNNLAILNKIQKIDEAASTRKPCLLPTPYEPKPGSSKFSDLENVPGFKELDKSILDIVKKATNIAEKQKCELHKISEKVKSPEQVAKMVEVEKQLLETLKNDYDLNHRLREATCKKCMLAIELNFRVMVDHKKIFHSGDDSWTIKKPKSQGTDTEYKIIDHGKERQRLSNLGKQNYIRLTTGGKRGYCMICDCLLVPSYVTFETHLSGIRHRGLLYLAGLSNNEPVPKPPKAEKIKTMPLLKFLNDIFYEPGLPYVWVNMKYWVEARSFLLLSKVTGDPQYDKVKCNACTRLFRNNKVIEFDHWRGDVHKEKYLASKVVLDQKKELIREIKPNLFHCGPCNQIYPYWSTVERHLRSWHHNLALSDQDFFDTFVKVFKHEQHFKTSDDGEVFYEIQLKSIMEKVKPKD